MINRVLRILITMIGFGLGLQLTFLMLLINNSLGLFQLNYVSTLIIYITITLICGIIFYFLSSKIIDLGIKSKEWIENRDPIKLLKEKLISREGCSDDELAAIEARANEEVGEMVKFSLESPDPVAEDALKYVYADREVEDR